MSGDGNNTLPSDHVELCERCENAPAANEHWLCAECKALIYASQKPSSEPHPMNDITQLSTLYSNAIARAEKAEEALRKSEWQPIETAPKDGTVFLAYELGEHFDCWWHDNGRGEQYWMDHADSEPSPTYWKPTPAPPPVRETP